MTITKLLDLWDQATSDFDNAMDYADYGLVNAIENHLDMLAEEILTFERQL